MYMIACEIVYTIIKYAKKSLFLGWEFTSMMEINFTKAFGYFTDYNNPPYNQRKYTVSV